MGFHPRMESIPNPRVEEEDHFYDPIHDCLPNLGFEPKLLDVVDIKKMIEFIVDQDGHIDTSVITPTVKWRQR